LNLEQRLLWLNNEMNNGGLIMSRKLSITILLAALLGVALFTSWGVDSAEAAQAPYQTQLAVGEYAKVTPRTAVRVREAPSRFGAQLGRVPAGSVITILSGPNPSYHNNMIWWYVEYAPANLRGWMSEGTASYRLLLPTDLGTGNADPTPEPSAGLQIGTLAYVIDEPDNIVRRNPDMDSRIVGRFPAGTTLEILDGPEYANGMWWWLAYSHNEGVRGWTPEGQNGESFLAPYYGVAWCANSARTRLVNGDRAYVLNNGTGANNLRKDYRTNAGVFGQIQPGESMTIVDGPHCDALNSIVWWEVVPDAKPWLRGWTAESENFNYYLAPFSLY
jgi:hypothetical protein